MNNPALWALAGTGFTFLMTTLGAAVVFLFKKQSNPNIQRVFLGFASGVMIAASIWSLLIPSIEEAAQNGSAISWLPAAGGFALGALFLYVLDKLMPHLHASGRKAEGLKSSMKRSTLLVSAVTLHNIPEGMAVGLAFALAAQHGANDVVMFSEAIALAIGIGIQNFPEGAAIALPLRDEGMPRWRAFLTGSMSGIVEPIFGVLTVWVAGSVTALLPWLLGFAAGAMIYVVAEELIPSANHGDSSRLGTIGLIVGFLIMMILDVSLG